MNTETCGLHFSRSGCALQGAVQAARAVGGVIPILHSTAGCSLRQADIQADAWLPDRLSEAEIPSTALLERQIVFGGGSRLREQIRNTLKVLSGDLYVVIPGCPAGMIGDDVQAIVQEISQAGQPVITIDAAGYSGTMPTGYTRFSIGLMKHVCEENTKAASHKPTVNIWGIMPGIDPYWEGDLAELTDLLETAGLRVTHLFGFGSNLEEWCLASTAALNLSVSSWGRIVGKWASNIFGTPYLEIPGIPVGAAQQEALLMSLASSLELDTRSFHSLSETANAQFLHALSHASADYIQYGFQTSFAVVAESARGFSLLRFLQKTLGYLPKALILTDVAPKDVPEQVQSFCKTQQISLLASDDCTEIEFLLMQVNPSLILGSVLEQRAAQKTGALLVEYSYPIQRSVILCSSSTGCRGILHILENLFAQQKSRAVQERETMPLLQIV